ncbi:unnamed protein product [Prunus armeniaca]
MPSSTLISPQSATSYSPYITLVVDPALTQNPSNKPYLLLILSLTPDGLLDIGSQEIIGRGTKNRGFTMWMMFAPRRFYLSKVLLAIKENQIWLCNHRLGHSSFSLKHLFPSLFSGCQTSDFKCDTCILAKSHRATYLLSANNTYVPFMLVHIDVWGLAPAYFQDHGIVHETTCPHTTQQNGVVEWKNRQILEITCASLIERLSVLSSTIPLVLCLMNVSFSEQEIYFATLISNSSLEGEILGVEESNWMVLFPDLVDLASHTKGVFTSCTLTELNHPALEDPAPVTLSEMPHPKPASGDVIYSFPILLLPYMTKKSLLLIRLSDSEKFQLPPRSTHGKPPDRYSTNTFKTVKYPIVNYISAHRLSPARQAFVSQMSAINIPTKVQEALLDSKWANTMTEEMKRLKKKFRHGI